MWQPAERKKHALPMATWPTADQAAASRLFSPVAIGSRTARARTWVPAMVPWRATEDGFVTRDVIDWYARFAEGKPGVLVVEATGVRDIPSGPLLRIGHDRFLPGLRQLVETVRDASEGRTKLFIQIIDFLAVKRRPERTKYFQRFLEITNRHRQLLSALTGSSHWTTVDEQAVREFLFYAEDELIEHVLDARELEALRFGYRERVTDTHLS